MHHQIAAGRKLAVCRNAAARSARIAPRLYQRFDIYRRASSAAADRPQHETRNCLAALRVLPHFIQPMPDRLGETLHRDNRGDRAPLPAPRRPVRFSGCAIASVIPSASCAMGSGKVIVRQPSRTAAAPTANPNRSVRAKEREHGFSTAPSSILPRLDLSTGSRGQKIIILHADPHSIARTKRHPAGAFRRTTTSICWSRSSRRIVTRSSAPAKVIDWTMPAPSTCPIRSAASRRSRPIPGAASYRRLPGKMGGIGGAGR